MASAIDVWEAKVHEIDKMALSNKVGLEGESPSHFNWDSKADINQRA